MWTDLSKVAQLPIDHKQLVRCRQHIRGSSDRTLSPKAALRSGDCQRRQGCPWQSVRFQGQTVRSDNPEMR